MKRKINIFVIFALITLSSCGIFKSRTVDNVKRSEETKLHVDSSTVSKATTDDKSETVILEKAKGTAYTAPQHTEVKSDLSSLLAGLKTVRDSGVFRIVQSYDSLSKSINTQISVKPQAVNYDVDKTTTTKNDIQSTAEITKGFSKDSTSKISSQDKHTVAKPAASSYFFIIVGILSVVAVGYFLARRYIK